MAEVSYSGNVRTSPRWLGDFEQPDHLLPVPARLDAAQFTSAAGVTVTLTANAAQGATTVAVTALALPFAASTALISGGNTVIPAGTTLYFGGAKVATLTAAATLGATSLTVAALPTALVSGDTTQFNPFGTLFVPSGTAIGRTWAERNSSTNYGPAASSDNQIFLTRYDTVDALRNPDVELVRPGSVVKENYLPGYGGVLGTSGSPSAVLTAIRAVYTCVIGKD